MYNGRNGLFEFDCVYLQYSNDLIFIIDINNFLKLYLADHAPYGARR